MKSPERELTPRAGSTHGVSSLGSRYPWVLLWSPVLLSSPLHTTCPDGADGVGLPWPCVDEVALQPSSRGWDQGPLTRLSLLLHNWLRDGQSVSALLGTGAWGPKQVRPLPKVTVCTEIRESGAQAWQGQENGAGERSGAGSGTRGSRATEEAAAAAAPTRCPPAAGLGRCPDVLG